MHGRIRLRGCATLPVAALCGLRVLTLVRHTFWYGYVEKGSIPPIKFQLGLLLSLCPLEGCRLTPLSLDLSESAVPIGRKRQIEREKAVNQVGH